METRRGILFLFFLFCGTFIFSANFSRAAGPTVVPEYIRSATTWTKANSPYLIKSNVYVQAKLTIEPGTVVKFWASAYSLHINAEFSARGTKNEKITFTSIHDDSDGVDSDKDFTNPRPPQNSDWKSIFVNPSAKVEFNNAIIDYGKVAIWATSTGAEYKNLTIRNSEIRHAVTGIYMENLEPVIESNLITKNGVGVIFFANSGLERKLALSGNSFAGNGKAVYGFNTNHRGEYCVDAKNNWWNDASGPKDPVGNPSGKGEATNAPDVIYDPWLKKDPNDGTPDPVIIIPGIMGSWEKGGKWQIDPIFHTYDNLRSAFLATDYKDGENYFEFPYEWRDSNIDNAKLLRKKIEKIRIQTGRPKVDIVAHSMGGLLAREYIESGYFANDVDQLITVGTPHLGAPKTYIKWEAGAFFSDIFEQAGKYFFKHEAKENGYDSIFHYIRGRPMASVQELLPVYDYLYDDNGSGYDLRTGYPANYPRNEFLENLNDVDKIKLLKNVEFTKIIGNPIGQRTTISGYNVIDANMGELWEHGYPHGFEIPWIGDQGIRNSEGDRTVPLFSAEAIQIPADNKLYLQSGHNNLPSNAQKEILEILTGKKPDNKIDEWKIDDILIGLVFSPVDIQIVSPNGKRLGKNFDTGETYEEIDGAYYTGFDTDTEFFTIPNPEDGEYKILAEGTGTGDYKIEVAKITEDESDPDNAKEATATIAGVAEDGVMQEAEIGVTENEIIYNLDADPPIIDIISPEGKEYSNNTYALNFSSVVSDAGSGIEDSSIEKLLNGEVFNDEKLDLSLKNLGSYNYQVRAKDKAGNFGSAEVAFQNVTSLKAIRNNVGHYFDLGLIKKKIAKRYLEAKLKHLEKLFKLLEKTKNSKLKSKPKQTAVETLEKIINADINRLISLVSRRVPRWFDQNAADRLTESLDYLKID